MKAVRLLEEGAARLVEDAPVPEPGPGEVRVRVLAAGICGTDKHLCRGDASVREKAQPPRTLGHEFCGEVDLAGADVAGDWHPGDYVTAEMHIVCGACFPCRIGHGHVCENTVIAGLHRDGAFAEYVVLPAANLFRLDRDFVSLEVGALLDALGNAVHTVFAADVCGRNVAILGYGPIGAMTAAVAEFVGAAQVFICEVSPYNLGEARRWAESRNHDHPHAAERVRVLDTLGDQKRAAARETIQELTGGTGVDVVLEISGHPDAINDGLSMLRWGGELIGLGIGREKAVTLHDYSGEVIFKGRTIKGIIGRRMYDTWYRMLGLLRAGLQVDHLVTHRASLDDFHDSMQRFEANETLKVVLFPGGVPGAEA